MRIGPAGRESRTSEAGVRRPVGSAARLWRQLVNATPWGRTPGYLVRDRDAVYGADFVPRAAVLGVRTVLTPVRAPRANAIAERRVGTLRRRCLGHAIVLNERHLPVIPSDFVGDDNADRPHRSLRVGSPRPRPRSRAGPSRVRPVLGGLHHT